MFYHWKNKVRYLQCNFIDVSRKGMVMKQLKIAGLILLTATITACSSTSPEEKIAKQEQRNQELNDRVARSEALVTAVEKRLEQANADNIKYFAPDQLETAMDEYKDAKEEYDEIAVDKTEATKGQVGRIAENSQQANMALDAAYVIKTNAETILAESFDIRNQLKTLGAPQIKSFLRSYRALSEDIDDIVEDIADGDLEDARADNGKLLPKLRALEVNVVKHIELAESRSRLDSLKKARATRYVPNAHRAALSAVRSAESTIANDPRANDVIKVAVAKAIFELDHTRFMLQSVQELSSVKSSGREAYITKYENALHKISQAAGSDDIRNTSLNSQFNAIATIVTAIKQDLDTAKLASQSSNEQAAQMVQEAQQKASALEALIVKKDQQIQAQEQTNTLLKTKVTELETVVLEKEKQVLQLEKDKLQAQTKEMKQVADIPVLPAASIQNVETTQSATPAVTEAPVATENEENKEEEQEDANPPA